MQKVILSIVITAIIVGGGAFYGGMVYGKSKGLSGKNIQAMGQFGGPDGQGMRNVQKNGVGGGLINGEVLSKDDKSVTIKLQDGGSKIVLFSSSTTIGKTTDGSLSDLEVGKTVMVTGTTNTDGSVTAKSIQIRPAGAVPAVPTK